VPKDVQIESTFDDAVKLTWRAPDDDGGSYITNYVVEKLDPDTGKWTRATSSRSAHCMVENLIPDKSYQFRVSAENVFGVGQPSEPTKTIRLEGTVVSIRMRIVFLT
jgi:titin